YFYPTTVMETGYDILFFWVARMIMMGLEMTGDVPFDTVYLHGLVRDAEGRKMSKTLGNVIDPLEVIDQYGTDALRFTLVTGSTPGQDINLAVERVEGNRNFANKIWNTARYVLSYGDGSGATEPYGAPMDRATFERLPLTERWIVSRHNQLVAAVGDFMERHMYGEAGRALYSFLWSEFADWYLEASKTRRGDGDGVAARQARFVLLHILERTLRLLHPFMPFLTEEIWQHLPRNAGDAEALMVTPWPAAGPVDEAAIAAFEQMQELIREVRNARKTYEVEPSHRIAGTIVTPAAGEFEAERAVIAWLARIAEEELTITARLDAPPSEAVHIVVGDGLEAFLPLADLVDLERERARLQGQIEETRAEIARVEARLNNPGFANKAPAQVVQGARDQLASAQERLGKLAERSRMLGGGDS
ncbi:MAG TPA: class I tRNA ligase family protein, partial [Ardenticatenaceae bacterium]|nr:class I tRNA ligase family protein [Ardenticatenaceae bacterium]